MWQQVLTGGDRTDPERQDELDDEVDDWGVDIDDSLFVVSWGREHWTLGVAPGTLDHLERLYIDQNGVIHREEKDEPPNLLGGGTPAEGETQIDPGS